MDILKKYDPDRFDNLFVYVILYEVPKPEELNNKKIQLFKNLKQVFNGQITVNQATAVDRLKTPTISHYYTMDGAKSIAMNYEDFKNKHGSVNNILNKYLHKLLTVSPLSLNRDPTEDEAIYFCFREALVKSDKAVEQMLSRWGEAYIVGVYITNIIPKEKNVPKYEPTKSKKRDSTKISTYFKHISTELDLAKDSKRSNTKP